MSGDNLVAIIKSPAFTILTCTICLVVVIKQISSVIDNIKAVKKAG